MRSTPTQQVRQGRLANRLSGKVAGGGWGAEGLSKAEHYVCRTSRGSLSCAYGEGEGEGIGRAGHLTSVSA